MIKLTCALKAWTTPDFENVLRDEIQTIKPALLPLQEGLTQSSHVSDGNISVLILNVTDSLNEIRAKAGIFYAGIIAGSCCSDDPTPISEQTEYCEVQFDINKKTAETIVKLV